MPNRFTSVFKLVEQVTIWTGGLFLIAMMLLVALDVATRSFFSISLTFIPDLVARYLMVAVSFLPVAMAETARSHIEASVFVARLGRRSRDWIVYFGIAASFVVYACLTWLTGREAVMNTLKGSYIEVGTLTVMTWPSYWIPPAAFGLMVLVLGIRLLAGPSSVPNN